MLDETLIALTLTALGLLIMLIGFIILFLSLRPSRGENVERRESFGLILIGPIPIILRSSSARVFMFMILTLIMIFIMLILFLLGVL